jgi:dinuclear metal center YbgI/SA1388 family protein
MANLEELVGYLDDVLNTAAIDDYAGAMNGLQLANGGVVRRIVAAVDASLPVIEAAAAGGPSLLIVHHGMFWQGTRPIVGALYQKLKIALDAGLAIYSSHLPLDVHPQLGNNALLARAIGLQDPTAFFQQKRLLLGLRGTWRGNREELAEAVAEAVGGAVHVCPGGSAVVGEVGLITGGAGGEVEKIAKAGIGTFITGEGPHWSYTLAQELGINVIYAGHYRTETFGVKAAAAQLAANFQLPWTFLDHPTGL